MSSLTKNDSEHLVCPGVSKTAILVPPKSNKSLLGFYNLLSLNNCRSLLINQIHNILHTDC